MAAIKMKRIIGIDVARALAVIGMIIVNFKIVFGSQGDSWLKYITPVFEGKAAATFVVLAGVGLALMTNSAIKNHNTEKLRTTQKRIIKRALFLFIVGLSYIWIWPADILHFYGIYMLLTLFFIKRKPSHIIIGTLGMVLLFPILILFIDYETGWNFTTLSYAGFWTIKGFFRNLFYNGFHPVIPWTAFMLFGLWYGRQDLYNTRFVKKSLWMSAGVFLFIQLVSTGLIQFFAKGDKNTIEELTPIFGVDPMPPMPLYMLNGMSIAIVTIAACILIAKRFENSWVIGALKKQDSWP